MLNNRLGKDLAGAVKAKFAKRFLELGSSQTYFDGC